MAASEPASRRDAPPVECAHERLHHGALASQQYGHVAHVLGAGGPPLQPQRRRRLLHEELRARVCTRV